MNGSSNYQYMYNKLNMLTQKWDLTRNKKLTYQYNANGQRKEMIGVNQEKTSYAYDDEGRLTGITAPNKDIFSFDYYANNKLQYKIMPNGTRTTYDYNKAGRITSLENSLMKNDKKVVFSKFEYQYDDVGNKEKVIESGTFDGERKISFEYDDLYRLKEVEYHDGKESKFTYDKVGNRLTRRDRKLLLGAEGCGRVVGCLKK